jgi:hypothetical protein
VVFVDDFVGSGEQFLKTWKRRYSLETRGRRATFKSLARTGENQFYYCNAMTTEYGRLRLSREAPEVRLSAGNIIPENHSLADPASALWPHQIRLAGLSFIERISRDLGYYDDDGGEDDWRGFHKLGLGIAFSHSVPDANLPLFFAETEGWKPLVRRL